MEEWNNAFPHMKVRSHVLFHVSLISSQTRERDESISLSQNLSLSLSLSVILFSLSLTRAGDATNWKRKMHVPVLYK